jgi:hypothetical protein
MFLVLSSVYIQSEREASTRGRGMHSQFNQKLRFLSFEQQTIPQACQQECYWISFELLGEPEMAELYFSEPFMTINEAQLIQ